MNLGLVPTRSQNGQLRGHCGSHLNFSASADSAQAPQEAATCQHECKANAESPQPRELCLGHCRSGPLPRPPLL
ncbi:hypothetical protein D623_10031206 [Myotis brandtii]|uniref:Uncharacterized protein n=1 Tax=Myotis brandtii TaxID=109478 RepID=S7PQF8_MYOBR|nr:hypothetical protein D623_10031206 [Myotis brandtii]